jgi:hypothetical protein
MKSTEAYLDLVKKAISHYKPLQIVKAGKIVDNHQTLFVAF